MPQQITFELGKKYNVTLANGAVVTFTFIGGKTPMVRVEKQTLLPLELFSLIQSVEECTE